MNKDTSTAIDKFGKYSLLSTSAIIAVLAMSPVAAHAQDASETISEDIDETSDEDEIIATGIRSSLETARDLKRDADTAVDSITASDVSTLPDLSVAEALARVPGVVVQRINLTERNGGDFPSPEGGGNLIRGLTLVRSEFNGRDAFSANGGRSLDFGTVPPELIGAVDVYKNTTADQIEGGIGGTINLRTLEPFDRSGIIAVATLDGTYTDLRDEVSPDFSAILGNRWDTSAGEFGLLGSFSRSELKSDLNGFQIGQFIPFDAPNGETIALPNGFQLRTNDVDRERDSYYVAAQYRNPAGTLEVTGKYALIQNEVEGNERTLEYFGDGESFNQFTLSSDFTRSDFQSDGIAQCNGANDPTPRTPTCEITRPVTGIYEAGLISNNLRDWTGAQGAPFSNLGINQREQSETDDLSLNIKWRPSDQIYVQLDGHTTTAESGRQTLWTGNRFFSDFVVNADLDDPFISLVPDPSSNPNRRQGGGNPVTTDLADPNSVNLLYVADQFFDNDGKLTAIRGDVQYEFANDGWFDSVQFGARFADRKQTNREAGLNWAGVSPAWTGGGYLPYAEVDGTNGEVVDFADFFRGGVVRGDNTTVLFANRDLLQNYDQTLAILRAEDSIIQRADGAIGDWLPLRDENGVVDFSRGTIGDVQEKVTNFYGRLDFGQEFENGMALSGNVGIRYADASVTGDQQRVYNYTRSSNPVGGRPIDFLPESVAFLEQQNPLIEDAELQSSEEWLPSLNLKWDVNDEFLIRFAASEAITRPRIDQLRGQQGAGGQFRFIFDDTPGVPRDPDATPEDIVLNGISVFGGNTELLPIESTNLDLSFEHYFGDSNSLTLSLFNKDLRNNIVYGSRLLEVVTLDGAEVPITYNGDVNQGEGNVRGFELAYQQFYDELPGLFGNLGLQANYTFLDSSSDAPQAFTDEDGDGQPDDFERIFRFGVDDILGLSKHAANIIGIYEDEKLEMRLAYNWRSDYLSAYRDFVSGNPIFQEDRGYLDGSIKYDLTDNFQVRFQIANILDTEAKATQQIDAAGQRLGRTNFVGDRRIRFGIRYAY